LEGVDLAVMQTMPSLPARAGVWCHLLLGLLTIAVLPSVAPAVTLSLGGARFTNHGKVALNSGTSTLPAAQLYELTADVSGSATGNFLPLVGGSTGIVSLNAVIGNLLGSSAASNYLGVTLVNLPDKIPATLANGPALQYFYTVTPLVISSGHYTIKLDKNGKFSLALTSLRFKTYTNRKTAPLTGSFDATPGSTLAVYPAGASSNTAQPNIMILANAHVAIGYGFYNSFPPGNISPIYHALRHNQSRTDIFLVQNAGPSTQSFTVSSGSLPTGFSIRVFDGKTEVTSSVEGTGYAIPNLASGAIKELRMKTTISSAAAKNTYNYASLKVSNGTEIDWASATINVK
jgi:hypothetical protein